MNFRTRLLLGFIFGLLLQSLQLVLVLFYFPGIVYFGVTQTLYIVPAAYAAHRRAAPGYGHGILLAGTTVALASAYIWSRILPLLDMFTGAARP